MSFIGNLLWIILGGGIFLFFEYLIGGIVMCLTIVGIPFGLQLFKLAGLSLTPFGKTIKDRESANSALNVIMNVIWLIIGGLPIALTHLFFAIICAITIIGIPFAKQHMRLVQLSLMPFGRDI
jgi:uncharacterized membrane protein YccF (DUF307 family)